MKRSKKIDDSVRMQIIEEYLNGSSKYGLVKKYNLSGTSQIHYWLRTFGIEEPRGAGIIPSTEMNESEELQALRLELKRVKKALAEEQLKARAYDRMIDIAEERWKIEIRKKAGTKPSGR